jgi:hypothetical protein
MYIKFPELAISSLSIEYDINITPEVEQLDNIVTEYLGALQFEVTKIVMV